MEYSKLKSIVGRKSKSSKIASEKPTSVKAERSSDPNEQVLKIMQELGIDVARTRESLLNEAYDNYAAIYLLLLDRFHQHRSSHQSDRHAWLEQHRRRPSSIAESALRRTANRSSGKCSPIPTHSQSLFSQLPPSMSVEGNAPLLMGTSFLQDSTVFHGRPHHGRQLPNLPGDGTPSSVYLYSLQGLTNRIGITSFSQDSEASTTLSHVSPPFRENGAVSMTATMAGKAYREGESGGSTSIDEGVEVDAFDSDSGSVTGHTQRATPSGLHCLKSASQQSDTFADSPIGSVTSNESTFESFESQLEPDIGESLTSVSQASFSCGRPLAVSLSAGPQKNLLPTGTLQETTKEGSNRRHTRSPVAFREGRRASDGLMTQGLFAFRQRLIDTEKARGLTELHSVQQEHQALTSHYQWVPNDEEVSKQQQQHTQYCHEWRHSYAGSDELNCPAFVRQRVSLPDTLGGTTQKALLVKDNSKEEQGTSGSPKPLQQQLFQHRLQQKRQIFQKQAVFPRQTFPISGCDLTRRQMVRQASYKMAQQQPVLPPLPVDLSAAHLLGEISCPPIAEDGGILEQGEEESNPEAASYWPDSNLVWNVGNSTLWTGDLAANLQLNYSSILLPNLQNFQPNLQPSFQPNLQSSHQHNLQSSLQSNLQSSLQANLQNFQHLPSSFAACQINDSPQSSLALQQEENVAQSQDLQFQLQPQQLEQLQQQQTASLQQIQLQQVTPQQQTSQQQMHLQQLQQIQMQHTSLHLQQLEPQQPLQSIQQLRMATSDGRHWFGLQGWHGASFIQGNSLGTAPWQTVGTSTLMSHQPVCESPILEMPENMES